MRERSERDEYCRVSHVLWLATIISGWRSDGATLRKRGLNRIGNLIVPNDNYCKFEDWLMPVLDTMLEEQKSGVCV